MQDLEMQKAEKIKVKDSTNIQNIRYAFNKLLFVPEKELKSKILNELVSYLQEKLKDESYPLKVFIAKDEKSITGIVVAQIDPNYRSYGRKCGTFGWLYVLDLATCKKLMIQCEKFMNLHRIRKLRGPINNPKLVGGLGFQTEGFSHFMMSGVNYTSPKMRVVKFLNQLGYQKESEYWCVEVTKETWKKGKKIPLGFSIKFPTLEELKEYKQKIFEMGNASFNAVMADAPGGMNRLDEMIELYERVSRSSKNYFPTEKACDPADITKNTEFIKILRSHNFLECLPWVTMVFTEQEDILVGIGLLLPNIYQIWKGESLTHANGDTVVINKDYMNKGIFSLGQNLGRLALKMHGINYFEGTQMWANNQRALKTMLPHTKVVRKHIVFQRRI